MRLMVTFGRSHIHVVKGNMFNQDNVASIACKSYNQGRRIANELFGQKFSICQQVENNEEFDLSLYPRGVINIP